MKRIFALALAFVLCFSLVACAAEPAREENKYAELERMLDEGRYGDAMSYILSLQGSNSSSVPLWGIGQPGDGTHPDEDPDTDKEPDAEVLALIDELMGEWVIVDENKDAPQRIVFREDGTCTVDGTEMTWKREATSLPDGNDFVTLLSVWEGEVERYGVYQPSKTDAGELSFTIGKVEGNTISLNSTRYICPDHYEAVELTMDNWQEYFEFTTESYHDTDAFGDLSGLSMGYKIALKEEYFNRLSQRRPGTGAVEISYKSSQQCHAYVNSDGISYSVGEVYGEWYEQTQTLTLENWNYVESPFFGNGITTGYIDVPFDSDLLPGVAGTCSHAFDFSVLRIQGTIYLLKEQ